jgi:hypothetical protein
MKSTTYEGLCPDCAEGQPKAGKAWTPEGGREGLDGLTRRVTPWSKLVAPWALGVER